MYLHVGSSRYVHVIMSTSEKNCPIVGLLNMPNLNFSLKI